MSLVLHLRAVWNIGSSCSTINFPGHSLDILYEAFLDNNLYYDILGFV